MLWFPQLMESTSWITPTGEEFSSSRVDLRQLRTAIYANILESPNF